MVIPFTGFPGVMRESLIVLLGFLIAIFGFYHGSANYAMSSEENQTEDDTDAAINSSVVSDEQEEIITKPAVEVKVRTRSKKERLGE